jgi:AcrR family transcriptional regulator
MRAAGEATRERILAVAKKEFSRYGVDGARINRIAAEANASKERLYAYFPSKGALFGAVTEQLLSDVGADTGLRGDDLPGYVGRLFDHYVRHPDNARLGDWLDLQSGDDLGDEGMQLAILQPAIDEIRRGQQAGHIDPSWDPVELFMLVFRIAKSMAIPKPVLCRLGEVNGSPGTAASRRQTAIKAVQRLISPGSGQTNQPRDR